MRFTPKHNVIYHGAFHQGGKPFDIAADDVEEMRKYGAVAADAPEPPPGPEPSADVPEQPAKKPGRPKKTE